MLTVLAPAKLNLTLEVLSKRQDGFHEIRSAVQTINLSDRLNFHSSQNIEFKCNAPGWMPEKSLVSKAASLLRGSTSRGATIEIDKHIPLVAGLGGDSSDAAATLRGLNMVWELGLSLPELTELAIQLGSDVALFLHGGTLLIEGRGERITPLPPLPRMWVVLLVPPLPRMERKTEQIYSMLKPSDYTTGQITDSFVTSLPKHDEAALPVMFNVFDAVAPAFFVGLEEYRQLFLEAGAQEVHLAGSGPTLFTLSGDRVAAENICCRLKEKGLEFHLTNF